MATVYSSISAASNACIGIGLRGAMLGSSPKKRVPPAIAFYSVKIDESVKRKTDGQVKIFIYKAYYWAEYEGIHGYVKRSAQYDIAIDGDLLRRHQNLQVPNCCKLVILKSMTE